MKLTLKQAQAIVDFFGGEPGPQDDPTTVTLSTFDRGHSGAGTYCYMTEYPDGGSIFISEEVHNG